MANNGKFRIQTWHMVASLCLCAQLAASVMAADTPRPPGFVVLDTREHDAIASALPPIAWVEDERQASEAGPAHIKLIGADTDTSANIWLRQNAFGVVVDAHVFDRCHRNTRADAPWAGDSLTLMLHPRAEMSWGRPTLAEGLQEGDLVLVLALVNDTATATVVSSLGPKEPGRFGGPISISRDEPAHTTHYQVQIPWGDLYLSAGASKALGVGIKLTDAPSYGSKASRTMRFGQTSAWGFRPQQLPRFVLAAPPQGIEGIAQGRSFLWHPQDTLPVLVAADANVACTRIILGQDTFVFEAPRPVQGRWRARIDIPTQDDHAMGMHDLSQDDAFGRPWRIELLGRHEKILACGQGRVSRGDHVLAAVDHALGQMAERLDEPVLHRHVTDAKSLLHESWTRGLAQLPKSEEGMLAARKIALAMRPNLAANEPPTSQVPQDLIERLKGQKPLVYHTLSHQDGALAPYALYVPTCWNKDHPARLVVFLHGKGEPDIGSFVAAMLGAQGDGLEDSFVLIPWARGNLGYTSVSEDDVIDAIEDVQRMFNIDADKVGLMGHSMGGAGAWAMAMHKPDIFSGVAVLSGGTWLTGLGNHVGANAKNLPLWIWHGGQDTSVSPDEVVAMQKELDDNDVDYQIVIDAQAGHNINEQIRKRALAWLVTTTRRRPPNFSYVADGPLYRGRSGVNMRVDAHLSNFPRIRVQVSDDVVDIVAEKTRGLDVELGPLGLGLCGQVRLHINNENVYYGPATQIAWGEPATRP